MIKMNLQQVATLLDLKNIFFNDEFTGLCIDTRTLKPKNLFIALPGKNNDGHHFVEEARQRGAAGALVNHKTSTDLPQLEVIDSIAALGKLGAYWRSQFNIPCLATTGSNGKTTLKNMIAAILIAHCNHTPSQVLAPEASLNNHLGLPLTLSRLNEMHRYLVVEMGMNHFGEIEYLTKLARPDVAIITNAAPAHLDGVGDLAGVARAKAEIFLGLARTGVAILNRDDQFFNFWREQIGHRDYLSFGFHPEADVTATIHEVKNGQHLTLHTPQGNIAVQFPLLGKHNVLNAMAAAAATLVLHVDPTAIKLGLENAKVEPRRLQIHNLPNHVKIIDDSYNANPSSLQAAIDTLASLSGKKIFVLGDMKELGKDAENFHQIAGEEMRKAGIDYLFTYGELSALTASRFGEGAYHFNEQSKLLNALKPFLCNPTTILIKGSRTMAMEKVVTGLIELETANL